MLFKYLPCFSLNLLNRKQVQRVYKPYTMSLIMHHLKNLELLICDDSRKRKKERRSILLKQLLL